MTTTFGARIRANLARVSMSAALGLAAAVAAPSHAAIVTTGCENAGVSCTLEELIDGGKFTVGEQTYEDFSFWNAYQFDPYEVVDLDFDQIVVTPFTQREGLHGFSIVGYGDYGAPANDWYFGFSYEMSSVTPLIASGIEFGDSVNGASEVYGQAALDDGTWADIVIGIPGLYWDDYMPPGPLLLPTQPTGLFGMPDIYVAAGDPLDVRFMHLSAPVPEPLSVYMTLAGLAVVTGAARRRRAAIARSVSR